VQSIGINNSTCYVGELQIKPTLRSKLQDDIEKINSLPHIKQLEKLAELALRTDGNAMFTLGTKYHNGEDFTQDKETGFQWIKLAAKAGLQKAERELAEMYFSGGDVVDQDFHEASIWTTKLIKQKNSEAQCDLGLLYLYGGGVRKDPLEASKWFTKSADQGNTDAQYQFGLLRFKGLGLCKDVKEALEWFNTSALHDNVNALYRLGKLYEEGEHIEGDVCRAIKLYNYLASNGRRDSQVTLAKAHEKGNLVDQNLQKAEKYNKLAANSSVYQRFELAIKYMNGDFGNSDYTKVFELFKEIDDEDQSSYYDIFQTPISSCIPLVFGDIDYNKLVTMFKLASERREQEICYNIGYLYENGFHSIERADLFLPSYTDAIHRYSIAAAKGDSRAKWRLGIMYEEGIGVEVELAVAYN
jgi:TPR repeat protein